MVAAGTSVKITGGTAENGADAAGDGGGAVPTRCPHAQRHASVNGANAVTIFPRAIALDTIPIIPRQATAMIRFSFLIPTRARTGRLTRLLESIVETTAR